MAARFTYYRGYVFHACWLFQVSAVLSMDTMEVFRQLLQELHHKYGRVSVDFAEAAAEIGFPTTRAALQARRKKKFPLQVIDHRGGRLTVTIAEIARFGATGEPASQTTQAPTKRRSGRPTKAEQMRRRALEQESV